MVLAVRVKLLIPKVVILKVFIHKNEEMGSILFFTENTHGNSGPVRSSFAVATPSDTGWYLSFIQH
jgi:hypothetical protein